MLQIDVLSYRSKLRTVHPEEKLLLELGLLFICVAIRSPFIAWLIILFNSYLLLILSGVSLKQFQRLMMLPLTFLLLSGLALLIQITTTEPSTPFCAIGPYFVTTSIDQLVYTVQLTLVAFAAATCLISLAVTTPLNDWMYVLKKYRCPIFLIELFILVYRFIFIMLYTAKQMSQAQAVRLGNSTFKRSMHSFALLGSQLFLKSYRRANQLYIAMSARGYDGTIHVLDVEQSLNYKRIFFIIVGLSTLIIVKFWLGW